MRKRNILALLSAVALVCTLSACGAVGEKLPQLPAGESSTASGQETAVREKPDASGYEDDLDGLCAYLEAGKAIVKDDTAASFTEMSYKEIGAIGGYRYRFTYNGSTVQAEFYEFDLESLDARGKECLDSVKEKGFFQVLDNEVPAILHPNGKYLMIYTDENAEKNEKNADQKQWAEELFRGFKA